MRRALSLLIVLPALVGCGQAIVLDCDLVPEPDTTRPATCPGDSPVLCRDRETGERCIPAAAQCWPDGDARCEVLPGLPNETLDVICLTGEFNRDQILRSTPTCVELTMPVDDGTGDGTGLGL